MRADAHVRHYAITVLGDAVIALDRELGEAALRMMSHNMSARILTTRQRHNEIPGSQVGGRRLG